MDGRAVEKKLTKNYLFSTREDRNKKTAKHVFKVEIKLSNNLSIGNGILAASAAVGRIKARRKETMRTVQNTRLYFISEPSATLIIAKLIQLEGKSERQ